MFSVISEELSILEFIFLVAAEEAPAVVDGVETAGEFLRIA